MQLSEPFKLNEEGYLLIQKLILQRIDHDINDEKKELEGLMNKQQEVNKQASFLQVIKKMHSDSSVKKAEERIRRKEAWKNSWLTETKTGRSLEKYTTQELINKFQVSTTGRIQLFLILQEVVHTQIYCKFSLVDSAGEEKYFEKRTGDIATLCGLGAVGLKIHQDTKSFFKEIKRENANILKWGIYGLVGVSTLSAVLAMPVIAPAIGGLMGLSGAAATASGLALLGGGSIAAGGMGMAGGMTILVGGSGILGAVAGGAAGKLLSELPQEAIALNVVKMVNLITYLKSFENRDRNSTGQILSEAQNLFLEFKQASEKELVLNGVNKDRKEAVQLLDILNVGLKKLI